MAEMSRKIEQSKNENWMALFGTRNGRHALVVGSMLQFFQQFTGIHTVMYYSATIIYMSGLVTDPSEAYGPLKNLDAESKSLIYLEQVLIYTKADIMVDSWLYSITFHPFWRILLESSN